MNQILLQVLSQDPLKTPGVCLSFRWLLPLIPNLETLSGIFVFPILGTWLGRIFLDMDDLWDQTLSLTGLLYLSTIIGMIPKPHTSSKLWIDANLFTVVCYSLYFTELFLLAYFGLDLEYTLGWIASISFSTILTFLFYGMLLIFGFSTPSYFKTIATIYLLTDVGNMLALGVLSPFTSCRVFILIGTFFLIYLLLPYRHPYLFSWMSISPAQFGKNLTTLRCLFWGALSVWADYIALTPFYILEMILATESHRRKDSVLYYLKETWNTNKAAIFQNYQKLGDSSLVLQEIFQVLRVKQKMITKELLNPGMSYPSLQRSLSPL